MSDKHCVVCGGDNQCKMAAGETDGVCWCVKETFPEKIFDALPEENRWNQCICANCLTAFKEQTLLK